MFIHLGGDILVQMKDIISIIDIEKNISEITKEFINTADEEGFLQKLSDEDIPKALVVAEINNKSRVFLSPISSSTLLKRTGFLKNISKF